MKLTDEDVRRVKNRRLKEPLEITGYEISVSKVQTVKGAPRTSQTFTTRRIETIGDLAKIDAQARIGKFIPVPDLSLQALMIVIDKMDLLVPDEGGET